MALVVRWTGREIKALREAKRMTLVDFAEQMCVSPRMVSKWEAGGQKIEPRAVNQQALDTLLACSPADVQGRFAALTTPPPVDIPGQRPDTDAVPAEAQHVRHPADGKMTAKIPAGIYLSGTENEPLWVEAYYIDVFPTTNADYARFTAATGHPAPRHWENGRCPSNLYDHPVVWVMHDDAAAYAAWAGKQLPTTQQWEKAARGTNGAVYPWGDGATVAKGNFRESGIRATTPVGRYHSGVSPYGVYDLCGNAWEWCSTETTPGRYELKGSAFTSPFFRSAPSTFNDADRRMYDDDTGFRCVATVEDVEKLVGEAAGR
ncbi:SUMF1/EgtB/PvdO family nonheme iron enzyme [Streptantibioticus ferralitis]|uniref:SUMF1/EgtB/PvdO family nonheme iron enzyme n=1 Tax=Streptantibioticus ferralitis TaxID=236510 RepID=A0ABT5ZAP7_9ACTN|nr:SUMF1/EgtB/PvdO family nonheme iron enzyme [Streptantibioticus ferralitis]MDF2260918.1 SUMF1/EgtB/PvdO family nonheme iron enzyme [Streptantibioticus ferralitis]